MSRFWEIVFCVPLLFHRHVCLCKLKHSLSPELPLTARETVFSHLNPTDWQTGSFISLVHQISNNLFCWFFISSYSICTITHSFQTLIGQEKWLKWWHNLSVFLSFLCTTFQETLPQKDVKNLRCSWETKDSSPQSVILQTTEMTSRHHSTWNLNILMSFLEKGQWKIVVY